MLIDDWNGKLETVHKNKLGKLVKSLVLMLCSIENIKK